MGYWLYEDYPIPPSVKDRCACIGSADSLRIIYCGWHELKARENPSLTPQDLHPILKKKFPNTVMDVRNFDPEFYSSDHIPDWLEAHTLAKNAIIKDKELIDAF